MLAHTSQTIFCSDFSRRKLSVQKSKDNELRQSVTKVKKSIGPESPCFRRIMIDGLR
jgi:hypothetical protein